MSDLIIALYWNTIGHNSFLLRPEGMHIKCCDSFAGANTKICNIIQALILKNLPIYHL